MPKNKIAVIIPNLNGKKWIHTSIDSLKRQSIDADIIVVDNGSSDESADYIEEKYPDITLIRHSTNLGFSGGVNGGLKPAIAEGYKYAALFNNDAEADKLWTEKLVAVLDSNPKVGIVTGKILDKTKRKLDSTADIYTTWGLPYPRGRGEIDDNQFDSNKEIFGASGGASMYRVKMLEQIGLFDEDFFAYFEDVDISFRAQLAGWKVRFEPEAIAYHAIGETSRRIPGFATYHTFKNLPLLMWKNVPARLMLTVFPRFVVLYFSIYFSAVLQGNFFPATKGMLMSIILWPKKLIQRYKIQSRRKVQVSYINSIIDHDLPPNAFKLRRFRKIVSLGVIK